MLILLAIALVVGAVFLGWPSPAKTLTDGYGRTRRDAEGNPIVTPKGKWAKWPFAAAAGLIALSWFLSSISIVDARAQKVQTSFGKVTGVNGSGFNLVAPWSSGTQFSTSKQWIEFADAGEGDKEPKIKVRLAGQATAEVWGFVYYTQPETTIDDLYLDWKEETRIREKLVFPLAQQALNEAFGLYNPLAAEKQDAEVLATYGKSATTILGTKLGSQLTGVEIQLRDIDYDDNTENRLKEIQAAVADYRVAQQKALTAVEIANANKTIAASLSNDPVTAFYQCSQMWANVVSEVKPANLNISSICSQYIPALAPR